ncbi:MAG TPA: hypothetical protein DEQ38_07450 [Elusimicrobia bacterium]|nr:MAG: hypothetical protein A2089_08310 [Elusimicrobia bacterium GWD2_63_28]HCC47931.1 hypothetical protein [Elusimicrobiota bacterium]
MKLFLLALCLALPGAAAAADTGAAVQLREAAGSSPAKAAAPRAEANSAAAGPNSLAAIAARCAPAAAGEEKIWQSDFRWDYTLTELKARALEMYASPKRLDKRAYWDAATGRLLLPHDADRGGDLAIGEAFVNAVARHIERAFELEYIDAVFFPDMGHSHILVPDKLWADKYSDYPIAKMSDQYRDMFADPRLQLFYHTAEQLKMTGPDGQLVADERTRFRHKTRNIAGLIKPDAKLNVYQNPASTANTVHEVPGHFWWGAGFNLSAQKDGCFVYSTGGRDYRFDISLYDLPYNPDGGGAGDY